MVPNFLYSYFYYFFNIIVFVIIIIITSSSSIIIIHIFLLPTSFAFELFLCRTATYY